MENEISVIIVEDEDIWIQNLHLILKDFGYNVAKTARTADEALAAFSSCDFDLALLDIHLDGKSTGIDLGKIVGTLYHKPFIFITSSSGHSIKEAALSHPSAYLPKPINPSSLFIAIQNAINNFSNRQPANFNKQGTDTLSSFFVKQGNRYKKIDWKDVVYLSAGKNYISVFNAADKNEYFIRSSLQKTMQYVIPRQFQQQFIQVNRSEVVQHSFIVELLNDEVKTDYKNFPVSEAYIKDLKHRLHIIS